MSVTYYPINEDTARNAHYMVHMGDYKPGSATASYRAAVDEAAAAAGEDAPESDPHFYMAKAHLFHALQVEKISK